MFDNRRGTRRMMWVLWVALVAAGTSGIGHAQGPIDSAALLAAQRTAMAPLAFMDGVWRGPAWTVLPNGDKHEITQTERIGPMLGGTIKVIEGRGYNADGTVGFNAFGVIAFDAYKKAYSMQSHAMGMSGTFVLTPSPSGYVWEIPAGPMTIRYTATINGNDWLEVGDRLAPGKEPVRFFEMRLKRVGDTTWPAADPVSAR